MPIIPAKMRIKITSSLAFDLDEIFIYSVNKQLMQK